MRAVRRSTRAFTRFMAGASLLLVPPVGGGAAAQPKPVGINAAIRNRVLLRSAGSEHPAVLKARVLLNDEVRTGPASQLQILLLDRSTFTVGPNARIAVDRFTFDPAANSRTAAISVTRGAFRFMSGRALGHPSGAASVHTPAASIGIRGTIFEGAVGADAVKLAGQQPTLAAMHLRIDPEKATFVVLRGPGPDTQGDTSPGAIDVSGGGKTVTLDRPGMAVFIPAPGSRPIGPFLVTREGLALLQPLLRTTPLMAPAAYAALAQAASGELPPGGAGPDAASPAGGDRDSASTMPGERRGFPLLLTAAIPAIILGLLALGSGKDGDVPVSP